MVLEMGAVPRYRILKGGVPAARSSLRALRGLGWGTRHSALDPRLYLKDFLLTASFQRRRYSPERRSVPNSDLTAAADSIFFVCHPPFSINAPICSAIDAASVPLHLMLNGNALKSESPGQSEKMHEMPVAIASTAASPNPSYKDGIKKMSAAQRYFRTSDCGPQKRTDLETACCSAVIRSIRLGCSFPTMR